jgi:hypothetical protein
MNEAIPAQIFTNPPTNNGSATFNPLVNDTFVIESLVALGSVRINLLGIGNSNINTVFFDSLTVNEFAAIGTVGIYLWGCDWASTASGPNVIRVASINGCRMRPNSKLSVLGVLTLNCCYSDDSASGAPTFSGLLNSFGIRYITQQRLGTIFLGLTSAQSGRHEAWTFQDGMGLFNNTAGPAYEVHNACFNSSNQVWGVCGAGGTPIFMKANGTLSYTVGAPGPAGYYFVDCTAAPAAAWISYSRNNTVQTTAPAWDFATSAFTAYRALTAANIQATVAAGGFFGQFSEPPSGCRFVPL